MNTINFEGGEIGEDFYITCMTIVNMLNDGATSFTFTTDTGVNVRVRMNIIGEKKVAVMV